MAGEHAAAAYAWVEARAYFGQALDALREDAPDAERAAILCGLGIAELQSRTYPDIQRGWDNIAQAFDLYHELGDAQSAVDVATLTHDFPEHWVHGTARVYSRALELVQPESAETGGLLALYGTAINVEQNNSAGSLKTLEQALKIARRTENRHLEARILHAMSRITGGTLDYHRVIELGLKAIELARETDQPSEEGAIHWFVALSLISIGDPDAAWQHTENLEPLGEKQLGGHITGYAWNQYTIAYLRGDRVNMDEAGEVLDSHNPDDSSIRLFVGIGAWLTERRTDLDHLIQAAQEAGQIDPLTGQRAANVAYLALAARLMDRPQDAIRAGEIARSILSLPILILGDEASARIAAGLAAVATGDVQEAGEHYGHLKELPGPSLATTPPLSLDRLLGLLAHTTGMPEEAAAHFDDALEFTGNAGYRLEAAWTCHDYAESLLDSGVPADVEKAVSLIDDGLEISRELGLVAIEERLVALQEKAASLTAPTPAYPDGLTEREVEVIRLLAAGHTNREIAGELVLSARTVQRHISNLYAKINVRNRVEATSFALDKLAGLAEPPKP
jgi:DNA-binding CsgD family transcriptional regulator